MKKLLRLCMLLVLALTVVSCSGNKYNIETTLNITPLATSLELDVTVKDYDSKINAGSVRARIVDISGESESTKTTIAFTKLLTKDSDDKIIENEKQTAKSLTSNTKYRVELYCTISGDSYNLDSKEVTTITEGEESDAPMIITTADEFLSIADNLDGYYKLGNDIDLGTYTPTFTNTKSFNGSFDGDNHSIKFTQESSSSYMGLFGYIDKKGSVKNLTVLNSSIKISRSSDSNIGLVAGVNNGSIENVIVKNDENFDKTNNLDITINATVSTSSINIGGFVGTNDSEGKINNCSVDTSIKNKSITRVTIGGFAGSNSGKISNSKAKTSIDVLNDSSSNSSILVVSGEIGGFVGHNIKRVSSCIAEGSIKTEIKVSKSNTSRDHTLVWAIGGFAGGCVDGNISGSVSNESFEVTSLTAPNLSLGVFAGSTNPRTCTKDSLENNVVVAKNNTIKVHLLEKDADWKTKIKEEKTDSNESSSSESSSETTEKEIDRKFLFNLVNCPHDQSIQDFNADNSIYVLGEATYEIDTVTPDTEETKLITTIPYVVSQECLTGHATSYTTDKTQAIIDYLNNI